jgi:hypothetical protein
LCRTNIGEFDTIGIEDTIDADSHTDKDKESDMLPRIFSEFWNEWEYDNSSDEIPKNRKHPGGNLCKNKFGANHSDSATESNSKKEEYFMHL